MKDLLKQASLEIQQLRRRNEILEAQMGVVEVFRAALMGPPRPSGASPDVVWALEKKIQELNEPQSG